MPSKIILRMRWIVLTLAIVECYAQQCVTNRSINGRGFHRELQVNIEIQRNYHSNCSILLSQRLPTGMYVDLHEIRMKQDQGVAKVFSPMKIDIEKPEYVSPEHQIFISQSLNATEGAARTITRVYLPVHLRYHKHSADDHKAQVHFSAHESFIWCHSEALQSDQGQLRAPCHHSSHGEICIWKPLKCDFQIGEHLTLEVPVGCSAVTFIVIALTLLATLTGTVVILLTIVTAPEQTTTGSEDVYGKESGDHKQKSLKNSNGSYEPTKKGGDPYSVSDPDNNVVHTNIEHTDTKVQDSHVYNLRQRKK